MRERQYRIQVEGLIGQRWNAWFEDLRVHEDQSQVAGAVTTLVGAIPDQAALIGLLQKLYTLGLPLLLVECQDIRQAPSLPKEQGVNVPDELSANNMKEGEK